jgi:hypothetical protein
MYPYVEKIFEKVPVDYHRQPNLLFPIKKAEPYSLNNGYFLLHKKYYRAVRVDYLLENNAVVEIKFTKAITARFLYNTELQLIMYQACPGVSKVYLITYEKEEKIIHFHQYKNKLIDIYSIDTTKGCTGSKI